MASDERLKSKYVSYNSKELLQLYESPELAGLTAMEKLEKFHYIAPRSIRYDPSKSFVNMFSFSGTGLKMAVMSPDFWFFFLLHIFISLFYHGFGFKSSGENPAPGWPEINMTLIAVPGAMMSFVLVFYLSQSFSRLLVQSARAKSTGCILGELIVLLRVHLRDTAFAEARAAREALCKLINALHFVAFSSIPQSRAVKVNEWAWWFLTDSGLLRQEQVNDLKALQQVPPGNLAYKEIILWLNKGIWAQHSKGYIDSRVASLFTYKLWQIRDSLDGLFVFVSGPVPFAYFHLIYFVLVVYLVFLSYAFVFLAPFWTIPVFALILVVLIGIRKLSDAMSNPLGSDEIDIPLFYLAWDFLSQSNLLINRGPSYADENDEMKPASKSGVDIVQKEWKKWF